MPDAPVLVVGATGRTGRLIVGRLLERGVSVRAVVRDAAKGERVLPSEMPRFVADVRRVETLMEPMAGVGAVIIATCSSAERDNDAEMVDYHGTRNLIERATAANVELVVFISTIYASRPEHYQDVEPTSLGWKARAEDVIRGSGTPYCIIRSGWLTDGAGGEPLALSQGDTAEGRISRADLADVCTQLLSVPEARGKTFEVVAAPAGQASSLASAVTALTPDSTQQTPVRPAHAAALTSPAADKAPARWDASVSSGMRRALAWDGGCCTNPRRAHWSLSKGGVEKAASSSLARDPTWPASALPAPSAAITARAAQVFADGFVRQPPSRTGMRVVQARRSDRAVAVAQTSGGLTGAFLRAGSKEPQRVAHPRRILHCLGAASPLSDRHSDRSPGFRARLCATATAGCRSARA